MCNPVFRPFGGAPPSYGFGNKIRKECCVRLIGYARVSTDDQDTSLQRDALRDAGVKVVHEEKASGVSARPVLHRVVASMQSGDVLVVWKLDRLARSMRDLLSLLESLRARGCGFRSLTEPIDTGSALGEFVLQVLGAVAQFERALIRERSIAGQVSSIRRGVRWGRPKRLSDDEERHAWALVLLGEPQYQVARRLGVSRTVIARVVKRELGLSQVPDRPVLGRYLAPK